MGNSEREVCLFKRGQNTFSVRNGDEGLLISGIRKPPKREIPQERDGICLAERTRRLSLGADPSEETTIVCAGICLGCKSRVSIVVCEEKGGNLKHPIEE